MEKKYFKNFLYNTIYNIFAFGRHISVKGIYILCDIYINNFQWNVIFITFNVFAMFDLPGESCDGFVHLR